MLKLTPETMLALGLTEDELGPVEFVDAPHADTARGDAATVTLLGAALLQSISGQLAREEAKLIPAASVQAVAQLEACAQGASMSRFAEEPRAVIVHVPGATTVLTGDHQQLSADEFILIAGAAARVDGPDGGVVVSCSDDGRVFVRPLLATRVGPINDWAPEDDLRLEPPSPSKLIGGLAMEPWLTTAVHERYESDSPVDRCVAVGLMGRLWSPTNKADAAAAREKSLSGAGPGQDGRRWWLSLSERERVVIVRDALLRVDDLADALEGLMQAVAEDPDGARPSLLAWLHDRDDLASLAFLARASESGAALVTALEQLDRTASVHHSMWSLVPGFRDNRLRAVANRDFDAWWATLAEDA